MPYLETPSDLADHLADKLGIYSDPRCGDTAERLDVHVDDCECRVWWVPNMAERIRQAVKNERQLGEVLKQEAIERHGTPYEREA